MVCITGGTRWRILAIASMYIAEKGAHAPKLSNRASSSEMEALWAQ